MNLLLLPCPTHAQPVFWETGGRISAKAGNGSLEKAAQRVKRYFSTLTIFDSAGSNQTTKCMV